MCESVQRTIFQNSPKAPLFNACVRPPCAHLPCARLPQDEGVGEERGQRGEGEGGQVQEPRSRARSLRGCQRSQLGGGRRGCERVGHQVQLRAWARGEGGGGARLCVECVVNIHTCVCVYISICKCGLNGVNFIALKGESKAGFIMRSSSVPNEAPCSAMPRSHTNMRKKDERGASRRFFQHSKVFPKVFRAEY